MSTSVMAEPTGGEVDETLFDRDVDEWMAARLQSNAYRPDEAVVERATRWLDENEGAPFFLWVHLFGPHEKGKRPEGYAYPGWIDEQVAIYDDAVRETDTALGGLLERLREDPRFGETAVILHADHGQSLMERGRFGHGDDIFEGALRVPLIVRLPGELRRGERVAHLVRNLDIFPTLLALAGIVIPATDGRSLLEARDDESHIYLETHHLLDATAREVRMNRRMRSVGQIQEGIRTADWKLVVTSAAPSTKDDVDEPLPDAFMKARTNTRLFNVARDPLEQHDFSAQEPEIVAALDSLLERHRRTEPATAPLRRELDDDERARLRALGYLE
jgi:arylsulfatase A-like enzyme